MRAFYGPGVRIHDVLRGMVTPPPAATPFLEAVHHAKEQAASR
jgi:lipid-binding SYLF domain-containing protein